MSPTASTQRARRALFCTVAIAALATTAALAQQQPPQADEQDLLSDAQVNRIRQIELSPADANSPRPPRIRFDNRAIQRFVDARQELNFRDFNAATDVNKALYMIDTAAPGDVLADVQIVTDPGSIDVFKQQVHGPVLQGCATSACHGSPDASKNGGLRLYNEGRDDRTIYTNFHTLTRAGVDVPNPTGGAFGGPETVRRQVIDRQDPDASLLLSYSLPADQSPSPHPQVEGLRPMFPNPSNAVFQTMRAWIATALDPTGGTYGFEGETAAAPAQ